MSEGSVIHAAVVRTMIDGIEDVAGVKGKNMVLRHAGVEEYVENPPPLEQEVFVPQEHYRAICRALREVFGKGSRAMLIFAGERTIYRSVDALPGAFSSAIKLVPGGLRRKAGLKIATTEMEKVTGVSPKVEYEKDRVLYHYYNSPSCEGYQSDEPVCYFDAGLLKAIVEWSTGKPHKVTEIECAAMGAEACVFEIVEM
jgi:divinyl protochlorophyllide a 8-vinyl-reductase